VDYYLRKISYEDIQQERNEVLDTKVEDIRKLGGMIEELMKQNYLCVFGSEEKIKANKDIFGSIINVFE
jgi:Zn-dependent M16 (insulinase) family peptidase